VKKIKSMPKQQV